MGHKDRYPVAMHNLRVCLLAQLFCLQYAVTFAQNWSAAGLPGVPINIRQVVADPEGETIYYAGAIRLFGNDFAPTNPVMRYAGGQWDTLGVLRGQIHTMVVFRDTLFAGGSFTEASGVPCEGIAYYDGSVWQPYGDLQQAVRRLRVINNELYAVGGFHTADGIIASGVAKRVGGSWVPLGLFDLGGSILDIAQYDGKLTVIGNVDFENGRGIAEWDGAEWSLLGPGIVNGLSGALCLTNYQSQLYIAGQIALAPGNPGQNIIRWDGQEFHGLGDGVQWQLGNTTGIATVTTLVEHDGLLFVGGGYRAAGGILANGLSTWDGSEWCAVSGDFRASGGIWGMDFYHDTLFVTCGTVLDGDTVNSAAKFIGDEYQEECSGPVAVVESSPVPPPVFLFPNPTESNAVISLEFIGKAYLHVYDVQGKAVHRRQLTGIDLTRILLDTADWPSGTYMVLIDMPLQRWSQRLVIQR